MCGRLSQYSGLHDFVAALSMPNALINSTNDQSLARCNAAPTTQLALFHQEGEFLHASMGDGDRIGPRIVQLRSMHGSKRSRMALSSEPCGQTEQSSRSTTGLNG